MPGGGFVKCSPSPVTDFSNPTESDNAAAAEYLEDSPPAKRFRLNSRQTQEKHAQELMKRELFKRAHKWATSLFAEGGKSARECHELAKKRFKGVAPSKTPIHHYVANLDKAGQSPLKKGPEEDVNPVTYKALGIALSKKIRMNQLIDIRSTRKKQIQWVMEATRLKRREAHVLWKRLIRDYSLNII